MLHFYNCGPFDGRPEANGSLLQNMKYLSVKFWNFFLLNLTPRLFAP